MIFKIPAGTRPAWETENAIDQGGPAGYRTTKWL